MEYELMLCTVGNESVNTSLHKKKNETWQTCFTEIFGVFRLLLRHPLYSGMTGFDTFCFWGYESNFVEFSLKLIELQDSKVKKYFSRKRSDLIWCFFLVVQADETEDCF